MKKALPSLLLVVMLFGNLYASELKNYFKNLDPVPGAEFINRETSVIINPNELVDKKSLNNFDAFTISGSLSGEKNYRLIICEANRTYILKPFSPFILGETVTIRFNKSIRTVNGRNIVPFSYSFKIKPTEIKPRTLIGLVNELNDDEINKILTGNIVNNPNGGPDITVTYSDNPSPGRLFLSNIVFDYNIPNNPALLILNNDASTYFDRPLNGQAWNFDKQPNGMLTYFDQYSSKYFALNNSYNVIDTFETGNGYTTDLHECRVLDNMHALLLSYDPEIVDMSHIVPGGYTHAEVIGLIIQEIDENKNIVFQWRSWDHFLITDATHENLLAAYIDYVHGNALEIDYEGNIMLSCRHMDEITKIDRLTGDIIWRLGGKNNEFTFIDDPDGFSHQHAVRMLRNRNITLFDNGNFHTPAYSRAVEYTLDEVNKTATLVWQYRNKPDYYGSAMGYVQRLPNNNTLICWGATNPTITEVRNDGTKELELTFSQGVFSYRAFRYNWGDSLVGISGNSAISKSYSLSQNYPNPFNPVTKIKFDIPSSLNKRGDKAGFITLKIYDVLGREITTLVNEQLNPGPYEVEWDAGNSPSGVYFYKLLAGDYSLTKKMILMK
jgi:hypothetical protein